MTSQQYSNTSTVHYASMSEQSMNELCTTNACREFPYVKCGNTCDAQCQRMKWGITAKYDFDFDGAGCASGMGGSCACKTKPSRFFQYQATKTPLFDS